VFVDGVIWLCVLGSVAGLAVPHLATHTGLDPSLVDSRAVLGGLPTLIGAHAVPKRLWAVWNSSALWPQEELINELPSSMVSPCSLLRLHPDYNVTSRSYSLGSHTGGLIRGLRVFPCRCVTAQHNTQRCFGYFTNSGSEVLLYHPPQLMSLQLCSSSSNDGRGWHRLGQSPIAHVVSGTCHPVCPFALFEVRQGGHPVGLIIIIQLENWTRWTLSAVLRQ
jgi:hypothetical protein